MFVFQTRCLTHPRYIINFPTKRHWRAKSRMEDIESGLKALVSEIRDRGIRSIAIRRSRWWNGGGRRQPVGDFA